MDFLEQVNWEKVNGLLPAIVQDAYTGRVLMLGYMSPEALTRTRLDKRVTFYSRTRQVLWQKGEGSGATLELVSMHLDCDHDTLLVLARPNGPTCHQGTVSCFGQGEPELSFLTALEQVIASRKVDVQNNLPIASYTAQLLTAGRQRIAQKVGEEAVETALAAMTGRRDEVIAESADLIFHLMVLLAEQDVGLDQVVGELLRRHRST